MNILITGGAGFIGSNLAKFLLSRGNHITVLDNFSAGSKNNFLGIESKVSIIEGDCTVASDVKEALHRQDVLFHFAANPEVRIEFNNSKTCFRDNVYATYTVMEQAVQSDVKQVVFASTSTVYGEAKIIPTPENYGELVPISFYGASKLASEALISSYCNMHKIKGTILRFANIIGPSSGHGIIFDFITKLRKNPDLLEVLGDGKQIKSYLHIDDCISAIQKASEHSSNVVDIFNIGSDDRITAGEIAQIVISEMGGKAKIMFTGGIDGGRGWKGDVKSMQLDITKIRNTGWRPKFNSRQAVEATVRQAL